MTALTKVESAAVLNVELFGTATIEGFITGRHGTPATQRTYRVALRSLINFMAASRVTTPKVSDLDAYISGLRAQGKSAYTIKTYVAAMRLYFQYLDKRGLYPDVASAIEPLKIRKAQTHSRKALSPQQAKLLLNAVAGTNVKSLRDKAIIALCLQAGLRTVEVERANVCDFKDSGDGFWTLEVWGKGRETADATIKVALPTARLILAYLATRGDYEELKETSTPLFTSTARNKSRGQRLSAQSVGKMIKARMKSVGINDRKLTAHSTRHYCAETACNAGVDIREIKSMLRHASITTTTIYLEDIAVARRRAELAVADSLFGGGIA